MYFLTNAGYSSNFIITEYGIIEGYVIPLITLPNFFTIALSNSLLPVISNYHSKGNKKAIKLKLKQALIISLFIGLSVLIILRLFPDFFLKLIYNTNLGKNYLLVLLPVFILYYIQPPLIAVLQGINKSKELVIHETIGIILKLLIIIITSKLNIGLYTLILGISINILITTYLHYKTIKKSI